MQYQRPFSCSSPELLRTKVFFNDANASITKAGAASLPFATWLPTTFSKAWSKMEFALDNVIYADGYWHLEFIPTKGKPNIEVRNLYIVSDGDTLKPVNSTFVDSLKYNGKSYVFPIFKYSNKKQFKLIFETCAKDGNDSYGNIVLWKSEYKEPPISVLAKFKDEVKLVELNKAIDWNRNTTFTSSTAVKDGDQLQYEFKEPVFVNKIEVTTGVPTTSRNFLSDGIVEISENGVDFTQVSGFVFGIANASVGKKIKSVRIKVIGKQQESNLTVQDLKLW